MAMTLRELEQEARKLEPHDRDKLLRSLIEELDREDDTEDLESVWAEEAQRRYESYSAGGATSRPAEEVFAEALRRIRS